jgi:hypothetical protein
MKNMKWSFKTLMIFILLGIGITAKSQFFDSLIGQVVAYDKDTTQLLTYEIVKGNEHGYFYLEANTGLLYLHKRPTKIVRPTAYVLIVKVTDNGIPPLSSKATCTVLLIPNLKTP